MRSVLPGGLAVMLTLRFLGPGLGAPPPPVAGMEQVLDTRWLVPPCAVALEWGAYDRARYLGGVLSSYGFDVRLANTGDDWWLLARPASAEDWLPVLPWEPRDERRASVSLGTIPTGNWEIYLQPEELLPLPENRAPKAIARALPDTPRAGEAVAFLGTLSYDPDGAIMVFHWGFGDGETGTNMVEDHVYDEPGIYTATLTVVDGAGAIDMTDVQVIVSAPIPPPTEGCGCG